MKKILACILSVVLLLALAACGGGGSSSTPTPAPDTDSPGGETKSARDRVYDLIDEYSIAFNGIPPKTLEDRSDVLKGLPVEKKDDVTVAYVTGSVGSDFFTTMLFTLEELCEEAGYTFLYQVSDFNTELSLQHMDSFILQGVDIILANADVQASGPTFKKAAEAGIPVVATSNQQVDSSANVITDILSGSYKSGWYVGEYTARQMHKKGEALDIGFCVLQFGTGDTESRGNGFISGYLYAAREIDGTPYNNMWEAMLDGYDIWRTFADNGKLDASDKGLNLVGYGLANGEANAPGGQQAANDLVTAHQDMDILYLECDPMWAGVEVVLKQYNITPGTDMKVVACADGTKYGMEAIQRGEILAIGNNSSSMNAIGMFTIVRNLFADGKDMNNIMPNTFTPTVAITAENVDQFYNPDMNMAGGMDYELMTVDEYNASAGGENSDPF